ncbi:LacI family DNA-binding transcriptional regulator [Fulvivirga sp. M361]|uniref:LacI family DNA-binding transcriptional regulator n=1 Tax=Fulvivirga sp. M361 TaxID=2594266 RepID=UPI0016274684|nr:LacI family DNA-binding transcriptional regulator [Fulvivirga sp. M361]
MRKKTTIVDIANHLGITPSAVSKAFSGHPRISDKTKKAVLATAEKLGYQPNYLATGLRKGRSGLIGVLVPGIHLSFFGTVIKAIEETLGEGGYNVIIAQSQDSHEKESAHLEGFIKAQVEGIIASVALDTRSADHYKRIGAQVPVVLFDRTLRELEVSKVVVDDHLGSVKAVDHLVSKGYRKVAHIGGYEHIEPFRLRIQGYREALDKHNLDVPEEYLRQCKLTITDGKEIMCDLLDLPQPPDAIYAASDLPAYGALTVLKERGYKIPEEFGIVGFSNEAYTSMVTPTITTMEQHTENIGLLAAKSVMDQLDHLYHGKEYIPQQNVLTPKLIVRDSTNR